MKVDGLTLAAQIVNFLVLVALLKRFLYRPVLRAMDERERAIAARLEEARAKAAAAEETARRHREALRALEEQREALLAEARALAEEERGRLLAQARREGEEARRRWQEAVRREREAFAGELRRQAGKRVVAVARRVLADLAGADLEELVVRRFLERLGALGEGEKEALREAWRASGREAAVRTAFPLPAAARRQVEDAVRALLGAEAAVRLETDPAVICGVELVVAGRRWRWSVDGYLDDLEQALEDCLPGMGGA